MKTLIGVIFLALPFIGVGIFAVKVGGWQLLLFSFGTTALVAGLIGVGVSLLD